MTSLATLAHAAPAAQPFNSTIYATAATIMPVLFLAIAIQGRAYQDLMNAVTATDRREQQATTRRHFPVLRALTAGVARGVLVVLGGCCAGLARLGRGKTGRRC